MTGGTARMVSRSALPASHNSSSGIKIDCARTALLLVFVIG